MTPEGLPAATKLAVQRTQLALERTLMAWIRTGVSLISFGFTIYKFFQYLQENNHPAAAERLFGPRGFALAMITGGIASIVLGTADHRRQLRKLEKEYGWSESSWVLGVAGLISILGVVGFFAVLFRA